VIRFEPRGCGRSDWDSKYDLETLLADAEAIRAEYSIECWIVGGHSHGPNLALAYALCHPDRTLGVLGIAGGKITDDREWSEIYKRRRDAEGEDYGGKQFHADPDVNPRGNASWRAYCRRPELLRQLAELQIPCAFIYAGEDIRPHWPTQQLSRLLPRARYTEIPGAAHCIWLSHAAELRDELHRALVFILGEAVPPMR
jgi:proline iminopeptidase